MPSSPYLGNFGVAPGFYESRRLAILVFSLKVSCFRFRENFECYFEGVLHVHPSADSIACL